MARAAKKAEAAESAAKPQQETYVFDRNFGIIHHGVHKFWEQGTEFSAEHDPELHGLLRRVGAPISPKK